MFASTGEEGGGEESASKGTSKSLSKVVRGLLADGLEATLWQALLASLSFQSTDFKSEARISACNEKNQL